MPKPRPLLSDYGPEEYAIMAGRYHWLLITEHDSPFIRAFRRLHEHFTNGGAIDPQLHKEHPARYNDWAAVQQVDEQLKKELQSCSS